MMLGAWLAAGAWLVSATHGLAAADRASVAIVDAPRPPAQWGYAPVTPRVAAGTWVTWSNNGQDEHTVTAVDGSFDSGTLDPSEGFAWYFAQPGRFAYVCALHPWMTGTVVVGDALDSPADADGVASSSAEDDGGSDLDLERSD